MRLKRLLLESGRYDEYDRFVARYGRNADSKGKGRGGRRRRIIHDERPDIWNIGSFVHDSTGNTLYAGINNNYLSSEQQAQLKAAWPELQAIPDIRTRGRRLREMLPDIHDLAYRHYDEDLIDEVVPGGPGEPDKLVMSPEAEPDTRAPTSTDQGRRRQQSAAHYDRDAAAAQTTPPPTPPTPPTPEPVEPSPEAPEAPPVPQEPQTPPPLSAPEEPEEKLPVRPEPTADAPPAPGFKASSPQRRRRQLPDKIPTGDIDTSKTDTMPKKGLGPKALQWLWRGASDIGSRVRSWFKRR
jgi:hypothetical protein